MSTVEDKRIPVMEHVFKDHKADYQRVSEDIELLTWAKPGTGIDKVEYLTYKGTLFIKGDLGEAVFQWYPSISLKAISGFGLSYFVEKCQASEGGNYWREWDSGTAKKCLVEHFRESDRADRLELFRDFRDNGGFDATCGKYEWEGWISDYNCEHWFGSNYSEWLYDVGKVVPWRMQSWLVGIKLAMEQLEESNG